jgi:mitochondrial ATPase complex subunit ATP10
MRWLSSLPPPNNEEDRSSPPTATLKRLEDANPERIHGIQVNPDSLGNEILPGNLIYKTYKWTGNVRKIPVELAKGYFWMVSDLKKTQQKPTLSNTSLIPESESQSFPTLTGLKTLLDPSTNVDLPWFFMDPTESGADVGKITLVAVTFRDSGFKLIQSWTKPFEDAFQDNAQVQSYKVSITEHRILYPLRGLLTRVMRNNTQPEEHARTLVYFGTKGVDEFRDVLRMHNIMTNYVFLLDDLGRVRFAGSGEASEEEVSRLIQFTHDLIEESGGESHKKASKKKKK